MYLSASLLACPRLAPGLLLALGLVTRNLLRLGDESLFESDLRVLSSLVPLVPPSPPPGMPPFSVVAGWGKEGREGALLARDGEEEGREKPRVKTEAW